MSVTGLTLWSLESEWGTPEGKPIEACIRAKRRGVRAPPEPPPPPPTLTPESEAESEAIFAKMRYTGSNGHLDVVKYLIIMPFAFRI
uniref:Uncharacterized protein n=1 Tax=Panagrellus redivivus TaxID=6233 RepID=A0A7E4V565_PANRE